MSDWHDKIGELVRELQRRTLRLKISFEERRLVVNVAPINDRRRSKLYVSRPAPEKYDWVLTAESGLLEGMRYAVNAPVVVGNDQKCDLTLVQSQISLFHTIFTLERNTLYVEDMGSDTGTQLNGEVLEGKQPLHHDDVVKLHDNKFRIAEGYFRSNSADELVRQAYPGPGVAIN
jgi:hypothetical protein